MYISRVKEQKAENKIRAGSGRERAKAIKMRPNSRAGVSVSGDEGELTGIN